MRPTLITGASGLLGANLVAAYLGRIPLVAWAHSHPITVHGLKLESINLTNPEAINKRIDQLQPACILHCAAMTSIDSCEDNEKLTFQVNTEATANLTLAAQRIGAKMVFVSTDAIYDGNHEGPHREEEAPRPTSVYARSKADAEAAVRAITLDHLILRTNIFGWNARPTLSSAEWMLNGLQRQTELGLFHDVHFSPLWVGEFAQLLSGLLDRQARGTFNFASTDATDKHAFGLSLAQTFKLSSAHVKAVSLNDRPLRAARAKNLVMNTSKLAQALGRKPKTVQQNIAGFYDDYTSGAVAKLKNTKAFRLEDWTA